MGLVLGKSLGRRIFRRKRHLEISVPFDHESYISSIALFPDPSDRREESVYVVPDDLYTIDSPQLHSPLISSQNLSVQNHWTWHGPEASPESLSSSDSLPSSKYFSLPPENHRPYPLLAAAHDISLSANSNDLILPQSPLEDTSNLSSSPHKDPLTAISTPPNPPLLHLPRPRVRKANDLSLRTLHQVLDISDFVLPLPAISTSLNPPLLHLPRPRVHKANDLLPRTLHQVPLTSDFGLPKQAIIKSAHTLSQADFDFAALWRRLQSVDLGSLDSADAPLDWSRYLVKNEDAYAGDGRFGTVYKGTWKLPSSLESPPDVAIKVIRCFPISKSGRCSVTPRTVKREVKVWKNLQHPNILPFIGIAKGNGTVPSLVSLWMANGTVREFIHQNPSVDRTKLVLGVAYGLNYLHTYDPQIIHGDLKAVNVLVDARGVPHLGDFGLSRMFEDQSLWVTSAACAPGTTRWMAPELLTGAQLVVTIRGDVYTFGVTAWEIMANRSPFSRYKMDPAVMAAVTLRDERPERLSSIEIPDSLWLIMTKCWATHETERPDMRAVISAMLDTL